MSSHRPLWPLCLAGLLLGALLPLASGAEETAGQARFRLKHELETVQTRMGTATTTLAERRQALAGLARSIRAARGSVPATVMEGYRALSAEAFKLKHGRERTPAAISEIHFTHGYPRSVKKAELEQRLQQMVTAAYGSGFRQLGADVDFSHGHIIYGRVPSRRLPPPRSKELLAGHDDIEERHGNQPVAILYHTQEFAYGAEKVGDKANGYVNRERRNWIQDWKTGKVYDAREWVKPGETMNDHFTIFEFQLDDARLGAGTREVQTSRGRKQMLLGTFQFQFHKSDDPATVAPGARLEPGVISTVLPDGRRINLRLSSNLTRNLVDPYRK